MFVPSFKRIYRNGRLATDFCVSQSNRRVCVQRKSPPPISNPLEVYRLFFCEGARLRHDKSPNFPCMSFETLCRLPIARAASLRIRPSIYHTCCGNSARSIHASRLVYSGHNKWSTIKHKKGTYVKSKQMLNILQQLPSTMLSK